MAHQQDRSGPNGLVSKPSTSFSTTSSAGSATSAATSRSGGSRLLFGEIDTTSDRSSDSYASVCSFVLSDSSTFLKFWLEDKCRDTFLSFLPKRDLASLRLVGHDFSVRAAPMLFSNITVNFKANTFTKPSRLAALDRLGFYVNALHFNLPHAEDTFLPPLVEPETGAEMSFTYTPLAEHPSDRRPKYGDAATTEVLARQYPPLFHASTNVSAFVRAFSAFVNLTTLTISCPGYDPLNRFRRSTVDYALISLRIAVEKNNLNSLDTLTLSPIHPSGLMYLSPLLGFGASPKSASKWSRIHNLTIHVNSLDGVTTEGEPDHLKLLQTYLRNFQTKLESFNFRWIGDKRPLPLQRPIMSSTPGCKPHAGESAVRKASQPLHFPRLKKFDLGNVWATAADVSVFVESHRRTIEELTFEDVELVHGTWDDALAPLIKRSRKRMKVEMADIPIMLSPTSCSPQYPQPMERIERPPAEAAGMRKSLRFSKLLPTKYRAPSKAKKVREGLLGCEEQLKKVLRTSVFSWI